MVWLRSRPKFWPWKTHTAERNPMQAAGLASLKAQEHVLLRSADCTLKLSPLIAGRFLICPELGEMSGRCTCCYQNPLWAALLHTVVEMDFISFRSALEPPVFQENSASILMFFNYLFWRESRGWGKGEDGCYFYRSRTGSYRHRRHAGVSTESPVQGPFGVKLDSCLPNYTFKRCQISRTCFKCQAKQWRGKKNN